MRLLCCCNRRKDGAPGNDRATILISALWIVTILVAFAISIGRQSAISLKITSYSVDRTKAYFIARAGMLRALAEKELEYKTNMSNTIDALSQGWANNRELFDDHSFGEGSYTVGYTYQEEEVSDEKPPVLYGLMDEQSKININIAPKETIAALIATFGTDVEDAQEIAAGIIDWRDEDNEITTSEQANFYGAEDVYYQGLSSAYHCKNLVFDTIYELTLVKGVTKEMAQEIAPYMTVYGDGKVNINTACERVLNALFGETFPNLASKVVRYRQGNDDTIGTKDDRWFCLGSYVIDRKDDGLIEIKNLQDAEWYANIYGITTEEYNRIKELISGNKSQVSVSSNAYRAIVNAAVNKVSVRIETVCVFEKNNKPPVVKFWYQE